MLHNVLSHIVHGLGGRGEWRKSASVLLLLIAVFSADRVIAMSFPSSGKQSFYRNPIEVRISCNQV